MSFNVVGIGEVLWDLLPDGPQLGGAPANFAYHAQALGANASVISRVGNDQRGIEVRRRFQEMGLSIAGIQADETAPTGTVSVSLANGGIPSYLIHENVAWDHIMANRTALECVRAAHAVCFGTLAQRHIASRHAIQRLLSSASASALRVLDVNLRQDFFNREVIEHSLKLANVLKLNDHELPVIANMFSLGGGIRQQIQSLASRFGLQVVAVTCGAEGSLLYRDGHWAQGSTTAVVVKDTVGAGDAFTAALCLGLLRELGLDEINHAANRIAAYVCGRTGAMPALPDDLRRMLNPDLAMPIRG
jgi:fructokinase